jgi:hypothetical protein
MTAGADRLRAGRFDASAVAVGASGRPAVRGYPMLGAGSSQR